MYKKAGLPSLGKGGAFCIKLHQGEIECLLIVVFYPFLLWFCLR